MSAVGDATTYATALLEALARDEAAGRRGPRLTEGGQATWQRFRGRLGSADLLRLLADDGAVVHPIPFAPERVGASLEGLEDPDKRFAVAVLWHPEMEEDKRLFEALVDEARRYRTERNGAGQDGSPVSSPSAGQRSTTYS